VSTDGSGRYMVVLWSVAYPCHTVLPDDAAERRFVQENGGTVVHAGIESERLADKICRRMDAALYHRELEEQA